VAWLGSAVSVVFAVDVAVVRLVMPAELPPKAAIAETSCDTCVAMWLDQ
jgi:hypothetical protein